MKLSDITVLISEDINDTLLTKWEQLWNNSHQAHSFNSPQWLQVCKDTFDIHTFHIISIYKNDELIALLPLTKERRFGIEILCSPGEKYLDRSTLLLRDDNSLSMNILLHLLSGKSTYLLQELSTPVKKDSDTYLLQKEASINPYIPLKSDPFRFLSSENRRKLFKLIKQQEQELSFQSFTGDYHALKMAINIDKKSAKRQAGKAVFASDLDLRFYQQLLKHFKDNFLIDIVFFHNTPIVFSIGLKYGKTYHACNTAYDINFRNIVPGKILLFFLLNHLKEQKMETFNFSRGQNELKNDFTKMYTPQYNLFLSPHLYFMKWWETANNIYEQLLNNKLFYTTYCTFKKYTYK